MHGRSGKIETAHFAMVSRIAADAPVLSFAGDEDLQRGVHEAVHEAAV